MSLANTLVSVPQSERGGEIAQRGFDYQTCWALTQMLEYELDGKSYVFIFEYHDDILILNDSITPTDLTFAQVKTKEKHWTAAALSGITAKKPISIIGKLFMHQRNFGNYSPKLLFVTNASFNLCEKNGGKSSFGADEVKIEYQTRFKKALQEQIKLDECDIDLSIMRFVQSSLSLDDHITHLKGKLCDFLTKKFGNTSNFNVNALASLLEKECRDRSKQKSADILDFADLISRKGFSSDVLNSVLDSLNVNNNMKPSWDKAVSLFRDLGKSNIELIQLEATFAQTCIELSQSKNNPSIEYLKYAISLYDEAEVNLNIRSYLAKTQSKIEGLCPDYALPLKSRKKECILIYSIILKLLEGDNI